MAIATPATVLYGEHLTELAAVLDQMTVAPYNQPPEKLQKADAAAREGRVTPGLNVGVYHVTSGSDATRYYIVEAGQCLCPYGRAHRDTPYACYHSVAARLYQRWQQAITPILASKETPMATPKPGSALAPMMTTAPGAPAETPHVPQDAPDDIPEPQVPPALLEAVTAPPEPSATPLARFPENDALLLGFCQALQQKLHTFLMDELKEMSSAIESSCAGMQQWVEKTLHSNEHAQYQLSDVLATMQEKGVTLRSNPYTAVVSACSPASANADGTPHPGFPVRLTIAKQDATDLTAGVTGLLEWLAQSGYTPGS
jgi:hypothetical protein